MKGKYKDPALRERIKNMIRNGKRALVSMGIATSAVFTREFTKRNPMSWSESH